MQSHVLQRFGYTRNDWVCMRHNFIANNVPSNYPQQSKKEGQWAELKRRDRVTFRRIVCTFLTTCLPNSRLTSLQTSIMPGNRIFFLVNIHFLLVFLTVPTKGWTCMWFFSYYAVKNVFWTGSKCWVGWNHEA